MPLHVATSVQRVSLEPRGRVRHQSIFCERASARGTTLSPRLLGFGVRFVVKNAKACG
jgi:hypothetical protein